MIRLTFKDTESRDIFANRFKLTNKIDDVHLDIGWHLLQFAKADPNVLDYEQVLLLQGKISDVVPQQFIVKGNPAVFDNYVIDIIADLGGGFYHVLCQDGTILADHVDYIEHTSGSVNFLENVSTVNNLNGIDAEANLPFTSQGQWARIRVSSRYRPLATTFKIHDTNYLSKPELYIIDSGIDHGNPEFQYDQLEIVDFYSLPVFAGNFNDDIGHGTAVASMAVGKNLGVCSYAKLMVVKIAGLVNGENRSASLLELGQAIDAINAEISQNPNITRVVNISWGVARSAWLDSKIQGLLDAGALVVCAAGNNGIDVENISPAGMDDVITVGSIDQYDIPSGFNNISPGDSGLTTGYGLSLDIFAPGEDVVVASPTGYKISSGTSFSAPLVSGSAVSLGSLQSSVIPYNILKTAILDTATKYALLFEDERFSDNQNSLVYLITADPNADYYDDNVVMYLGSNLPIIADLNSSLDAVTWNIVYPDNNLVWSLGWLDETTKNEYENCVTIDPVTGIVTITEPTVALSENTKLKSVEFYGIATSANGSIKMRTPVLLFFQTNPAYTDTIDSDITLALTEINSISFFQTWTQDIK